VGIASSIFPPHPARGQSGHHRPAQRHARGLFLGTVQPGGRPHAAGIGAVWHDGDPCFTSGPGTCKARNLASNPACTISVKLPDTDLTLDGEAARVTEPAILQQVASTYRGIGCPAEAAGDGFTVPYSARALARRRGIFTSSPSTSSSV
jgi:hypothetical protein